MIHLDQVALLLQFGQSFLEIQEAKRRREMDDERFGG